MTAYYNEFDPFAASWLEELIKDGLIAPGVVDRRSIVDVVPSELKGYTQCHFFAGIGVWSLALRIAGWSDDRPIWTGSAPCQPFSAAGKGDGFDDERHLWPAFHWHIAHGKPTDVPVIGEQVASKAGRAWFDLVQSDMEALDHACGAVDTSAAGNGAPFIGQRLYWLATANQSRSQRWTTVERGGCGDQLAAGSDGVVVGLAASDSESGQWYTRTVSGEETEVSGQRELDGDFNHRHSNGQRPERMAPSRSDGLQTAIFDLAGSTSPNAERKTGYAGLHGEHGDGIPLRPTDFWSDPDWLLCRDPDGARFRPVEPSTLIVADGRAIRWRMAEGSGEGGQIQTHFPLAQAKEYLNRLDEVRGAGNALNVAQAANFISAVTEYLDQ